VHYRAVRRRIAGTGIALSLVLAGTAWLTVPALAAGCPTVDPSTGTVSPAPTPGVQWAGCDLANANLAEADMSGGDLSSANLTGAELSGANLNGANLTAINLGSANLTNASLTNANLTDANLAQAIMSGTDLTGATLSGVTSGLAYAVPPPMLPANWIFVNSGSDRLYLAGPGANLRDAYLVDANLTNGDLESADLTGASMAHATIAGADFTGATLTGVSSGDLTGAPAMLPANWQALSGYLIGPAANLSYAGLSGLGLSSADLAGVNLTSAAVIGTDLSHANLVGATLASTNLSSATLASTNLSKASLTGTNLASADLTGASLTGVQSSGITGTPAALPVGWSVTSGYLIGPDADLHGDSLADLDLASANLTGADLDGTDLDGTNLTGANFTSSNLTGALLDSATAWNASFADANLTSANLSSATITGANLGTATLTGAGGSGMIGSPASLPAHWSVRDGYLFGPDAGTDLTDVSLANLNLSRVDLSGMTLLRTKLKHANLASANLTKATLNGTDFSYANLTKADLAGAKVSSAIFAGAIWSSTICPDGRLSSKHAHGRCFGPPPSSGFTASSLPLPPGASVSQFTTHAVACPSSTECFGGGIFYSAGGPSLTSGAALLRWNGKTWMASDAPRPGDVLNGSEAAASLNAVACPATKACFAGGSYRSTSGNKAMFLTWKGGSHFSAMAAPVPSDASVNSFGDILGIACASATSCLAVGSYDNAAVQRGMVLRLAGGKWRAAAAPVPPGSAVNGSVDAISCPSLTLCVAGGWQDNGNGISQAVLLRWTAGKWSAVKSPLPSGAAPDRQGSISGVSCPSVSRCIAVGSYLDAKGNSQAMLLTRSSGKWTAAKASLPAGAASNPWANISAVSCPAVARCTAAGGYTNSANELVGLLLFWSGKAWRAVPAPAAAYQLNAISCPSETRCVALSAGRGHPQALIGP
jgi:uncharacterized protein YjbI with pentapeptide repeats